MSATMPRTASVPPLRADEAGTRRGDGLSGRTLPAPAPDTRGGRGVPSLLIGGAW